MSDFKLTEEISRWAFEISVKKNKDFWIAFTNPTAGPWKTIISKDKKNNFGEIYRFKKEEERPDVILVSDTFKLIIIIEAKDSFEKLSKGEQVDKSCLVVKNISIKLKNIKNNNFWLNRYDYEIINGLLWGADQSETKMNIKNLFKIYENKFNDLNYRLSSFQIGIETVKNDIGNLELNYYLNNIIDIENKLLMPFKSISNQKLIVV